MIKLNGMQQLLLTVTGTIFSSWRRSSTALILLGDSVPVGIFLLLWVHHCDQLHIHHSWMTQWRLVGRNNLRFDQASALALDRFLFGYHQSPSKLTRIHIYEMPTNTKDRNGLKSWTAMLWRVRWSPKTACKRDYLPLLEIYFPRRMRRADFPLWAFYVLVDSRRPVFIFGWLIVNLCLVLFFLFHTNEPRSALIYQGSIH